MRKSLGVIFAVMVGMISGTTIANSEPARCDMDAYMKVIAGCFTGRAEGFSLPGNLNYVLYPYIYTQSWNLGPYDTLYKGTPFQSAGDKVDPSVSIMPPYMWGAVGQMCDIQFDPVTHPECVSKMKYTLNNPVLNARYSPDQFYWRAHGHNCHDAAEDVGMCLLNASQHMLPNCGFEAKVIVWDAEPDIKKALGNVYHSQLLVKRMRQTSPTTQELAVCLAESQASNPSGVFENSCCTNDLSLFEKGTIEQYYQVFGKCKVMFAPSSNVFPHLYELASFREMRQTGAMDVPNTYNRESGVYALQQKKGAALGGPAPVPRILGGIYDKNGVPLALNIR